MANRFAKFILRAAAVFLVASVALVLILRFVPITYTPLMAIRQLEAISEGRVLHLNKEWVPLSQISPNVVVAVVQTEDATFFEHGGFSLDDIIDAYAYNKRHNRILRGGSTISQQTAKNVFCTPSRTYTRKIFEAYFTVLIELLWGKDRIMEVYLNVAETGDGVFGVARAADLYYNTSAAQMSTTSAYDFASWLRCPRCRW